MENDNCEICNKIKCRECGWEPSNLELAQIQKLELTVCPLCGWSPS